MFGFRCRLVNFVVILAIGAFWLNDTQAMDLSKPLPKLSAKEVLHYGPSRAFFEQYDQGVQGNCDPLLSHLHEKLQSPDSDVRYSAQLVYAEMYDRAVCVEYSPEKSFKYFKQAADGGGFYFYAHVGWKHIYGHGAKKSMKEAHKAFKLLLTRLASSESSRTLERYIDLLKDRPIPTELKTGVGWLINLTNSDSAKINFALNLIHGTARYYDNSLIKQDHRAGYEILTSMANNSNPEAMYILAQEILSGRLDGIHMDESQLMLENAASCNFIDAMLLMAEYHEKGTHGFVQTYPHAYSWLYTAKSLGANVDERMKELKEKMENTNQGIARQEHPWNYYPDTCRAE